MRTVLHRSRHRKWEDALAQWLKTMYPVWGHREPDNRFYKCPGGFYPFVKSRCFRKKVYPDMGTLWAEFLLTRQP